MSEVVEVGKERQIHHLSDSGGRAATELTKIPRLRPEVVSARRGEPEPAVM